jgi:hypothetical protein
MEVQVRVESDENTIKKEIETKYFGLLEDNRIIDPKRVDLYIKKIEEGNYIDTYPIMCYEADNLAAAEIKITDFDRNAIPADKLSEYLIIIDGQHRVDAYIKYKEVNPDKPLIVPNVNVKEANSIDDVLKFLVAINTAGKDWNDSDRWNIARNVNKESVKKIIKLINDYKFKNSTAQKVYLKDRISRKDFLSYLDGNYSIIDNMERIEIGDKFIDVCLELSGSDVKKMKLFSKRYFIDGFDDFSKGKDYEKVFEIMKKLNYDDLKTVKSKDDFEVMLKKTK